MTVQAAVPDWVVHRGDDRAKRSTIYSLNSKIRIWATKPILDEKAEENQDQPRLLSTLARHTGAVLCVRWSHSGRYVASGSDDTVALIWDLDTSGTGSGLVFGSSETNIEHWRPHRRLPGHESDVTDVAWSQNDAYLATAGLDSLVLVWSGETFDRLRTIRGHHGFVKGIDFDPLGQFLASSSDDRSVKVWRTTDWGLEASVCAPFKNSPSSTFFRRGSWTPDGANFIASNAMNGPVFVASVVKRLQWSADFSLVGHENAVTVAACSPRLFRGAQDGQVATVVALGAQDQSVSVWITGQPRPLFVARDLFDRHVMDMSWSQDGYTVYACSSDGTVAVLQFSAEDFGETLPQNEIASLRAAHGIPQPRALAPLPATIERPNTLPIRRKDTPELRLTQQITRNADGKRRIRPTLLAGSGDVASSFAETHAELPLDKNVRVLGAGMRPAPETNSPLSLRARSAPSVLSSVRVPCIHGTVDARNYLEKASEIALLDRADRVRWLDFVPAPAICASGSASHVAVGLSDNTVLWYAVGGRRMCTMVLTAPPLYMASHQSVLAVLTQDGTLRRWDTAAGTETADAVRLPVQTMNSIERLDVHSNGTPILFGAEHVFAMDPARGVLMTIASSWSAQHSTASKQLLTATLASEPVRFVENHVISAAQDRAASEHPDLALAATLRHLDMRIGAAELLESGAEYRQAVLALARELTSAGILTQAEDLATSLLGPIYYKPGAVVQWKPNVCGIDKRELLGTVLDIMQRNSVFAQPVQRFREHLRAIQT
ncbi:Hir1p [Malassezia vespertilionis]|uniref:Protein HIR n=1 Tax=Malassezia vespertilionis TaxID=2020962 RepID=A0A2N1JFJ3_9BASI|nr:Hir1p [Malassezia vespertilionis]